MLLVRSKEQLGVEKQEMQHYDSEKEAEDSQSLVEACISSVYHSGF